MSRPWLSADRAAPLVGAGMLRSPLALARAQVASRSTSLGPTGVDWVEAVADVPRFGGTARRLLVGGQRTNLVRNPRCEGVVAGTPGTGPTNWSISAGSNGITREIVGAGVGGGINYVDVRVYGTAEATTFTTCHFDTLTQFPIAPGAIVTVSCFLRLVGGSLTGISLPTGATNFNSASAALDQYALITPVPTNAPLTGQRFTVTSTSSTFSNVNTAFMRPFTQLTITSGATVDCTLRIGWPQVEMAPFASSPILPAVGTPAASTRGADLVSATLASLGIGANGASTVLMSAMLPQAAVSPTNAVLLQIDDGTDINRFLIRNDFGTNNLGGVWFTSVGSGVTGSAGTFVAGTPFRIGATIDGSGRIAASFNGNAPVEVTGGPVSGLTRLRLGNTASGTVSMFGEVGHVRVLPYAVSDTALQSLLLATPI